MLFCRRATAPAPRSRIWRQRDQRTSIGRGLPCTMWDLHGRAYHTYACAVAWARQWPMRVSPVRERENRFAMRPLRVDFHGPTQWLARCPRDGRIPNCVTSLPQAPRPHVAFAFPTEVNYSPWPLSPDRLAGARTILGKTPNYREIAHNGNREATHMYRNAGSSNRSGFENGLIYVHRVYLCAFRR